ncbi:DUF87 domain-containing protein [Xylanibacillus composti]|uniref:Sea9 n=1 Tax=Xylanibacillus composti TaxID=1572762 RepID=A0A8J4H3T8_9BACL|nr:ATP-binding protein [Xylanibacillus composti]MDT9724864.1 DUF87 domain-containing protein [Xylanibacillus composti]GIQ69041.1 sea9 [Xylanibacillus composti]
MSIFQYADEEGLGKVAAVDTTHVTLGVDNVQVLRNMQVNRLVALRSSRAGQHYIGIIQKIIRRFMEQREQEACMAEEMSEADECREINTVRIALIGTFYDRYLEQSNVFRRSLESVPEIEAVCFPIEGEQLSRFMRAISCQSGEHLHSLCLGHYALDEEAPAFLDANKLFQRHAVIVGSTGSGKSWATARLVEQIAQLPNANALLFDLHGEYQSLTGEGIQHYKIAGPHEAVHGGGVNEGILHLPYWLLSYEDLIHLLVDRSDQHAPNQAMLLSRMVVDAKRAYLERAQAGDLLANFTIDSPVPYDLAEVLDALGRLNAELVPGARGERQGDYYGRLSKLIARLENKRTDRRLAFMLNPPAEVHNLAWLETLAEALLCGKEHQPLHRGGVKVIDLSEVPSDMLPLVVGRIASLVFTIQQWTDKANRHPVALLCEEAHLYLPHPVREAGVEQAAPRYFGRIAKEGRKYGVGLVIISQRPSEVHPAILSQCNNFITLRLSNAADQQVIHRLLPESLGGFAAWLPMLDAGEALVVGDASLLPSRIRIAEPKQKPNSRTFNFWEEWSSCGKHNGIRQAVHAWRMQSQAGE